MIYLNTVKPTLASTLKTLMNADVFSAFRLVGGTSLSLQLGHRMSDDIDLFTDAPYNTVDFAAIDAFLKNTFRYTDTVNVDLVGMGKSYYIGSNDREAVKLDLFYTEKFIRQALVNRYIRMATIEDIIAMKIDIIQRTGRKKDFWDLHELLDNYPLNTMLALHRERYPYTHNRSLILKNLSDFESADYDFDPVCLRGKYWEIVKLDIVETLNDFTGSNN